MPHVTFIHGIANKPPPDRLLRSWERALAANDGINLGAEGVTRSMVYWADVMYESPMSDDGFESLEASGREFDRDEDIDLSFIDAAEGDEAEFVRNLMGTLNFEAVVDDEKEPPESDAGVEFERIPLPGWLKKRLMKALLRDVHHYLYNTEHTPRRGETFFVQDEIRRRMTEALVAGEEQAGDEAHIVVSHSMGTVIAYDCLKRVPGAPRVDALVTIGSPLGLDEIQDGLQPGWTRADGFPSTGVSGPWYNVFDRLDPVAGFDPELANDYLLGGAESVKDVSEANYGKWRHSISKYLGQPQLRDVFYELLDL
jgi:hypothetical protein